jgi:tetratricopeptide (TPR) repeat protein
MKLVVWIATMAAGLYSPMCVASAATLQSTVESLTSEADLAFRQGRFSEAEKAYLQALEVVNTTSGEASRQPAILNSLAAIYDLRGRYADAESLSSRALKMVEAGDKTDPILPIILGTLGSVEAHLEKFGRAEHHVQRAIALRERYLSDHRPELLADYTLLGVVLCARGKCKHGEQLVRRALTLCEPGVRECQGGVAVARTGLARIEMRRKHYTEAEQGYREALATLEATSGPSDGWLVPVLSDLSSLYVNQKRYAEAVVVGRRALEIAAEALSDSEVVATAAWAIGQALSRQGEFEAAEPYFKQSLAIHQRTQGAESIAYAEALQQYARFLRRAKRPLEASVIETRVHALLRLAEQKMDVADLPTRSK